MGRWLLLVLGLQVPERGLTRAEVSCHHCLREGCLARGSGHAKVRYCFLGVYGPLKEFRKVHRIRQDRQLEKATVRCLGGHETSWGWVSRSHRSGANSVNEVDGDLDIMPSCAYRIRPQKRNIGSANTSVWGKNLPSNSCPKPNN